MTFISYTNKYLKPVLLQHKNLDRQRFYHTIIVEHRYIVHCVSVCIVHIYIIVATHIYIFVATSGSISSLQLYSPLMRDNFHRDEYKCSKEAERNHLCSLHLLFVCHRVTVNPGVIRTCAGAGRVKSPQLLLFTVLDVDYFCTPRPLPRAAASPHVRGSRTFLAFSSRAAEAS